MMAGNERFDDTIGKWLEEAAPTGLPGRVLDATFERTRRTRQELAWRAVLGRTRRAGLIPAIAGAAVAVVAFAVVLTVIPRLGVGGSPTPAASPTPGASPSQRPLSSCTDSISPGAGTVLGCSRDGTRLLIQKDDLNLFVLRADGSETQVTTELSGMTRFAGSSRPAGATISPDGSRVVFAGLTTIDGLSCHNGALFGVDAGGGPADVLWTSQVPQNGIVRYPTFSPDGTRIAFSDGYCDSDHSVWLMNADGTDAHLILSLGAGWVDGLAWSPAGDQLALTGRFATESGSIVGGFYTLAADGSGFIQDIRGAAFCWPGLRC